MITILFGAGASFGSYGCLPHPPPLGDNLFNNLCDKNGPFSRLDGDTRVLFSTQGFELGMASVADDSRVINPLQKELACYFSSFRITNDSAYLRLFNKLRRYINQITIATLNYDILIEQALGSGGFSFDYNGEGQQGINLLKLHGSSNFLPQLPPGLTFSGNTMINCGSYFEGLEIHPVYSNQEVINWCNDPRNSDLSPTIAQYRPGKRVVVNSETIKRIQLKYADIVNVSSLIVLVGTRYLEYDEHVWTPILSSNARLLIVNPVTRDMSDLVSKKDPQKVNFIEKGFFESVFDIARYIKAHLAYRVL